MKQIIFALAFIYFVLCDGPAYNAQNREEDSCVIDVAESASFFFFFILYNPEKGRYYDKCCYLRYRAGGEMVSSCIGVTNQEYFDIPEYSSLM